MPRGKNTPIARPWLSVAPKAAGFVVIFRLYLEGAGNTALLWAPLVSAMAAATIVIAPLVLAFLVAQRRFVEGITFTGLKG